MKKGILAIFICILLIACLGFVRTALEEEPTTLPEETDPVIPETTLPAPTETVTPAGWYDVDGKQCYLLEGGAPATGWLNLDGKRYYFSQDGSAYCGWLEEDGKHYYLPGDGSLLTGWANVDGCDRYFLTDGTAASGKTEIDGKTYYFSTRGIHIILVNPWVSLPEDYAANLMPISNYLFAELSSYQPLNDMLDACREAGFEPYVCSAYRSEYEQSELYWNKVKYYLKEGWGNEDAKNLAGTVVAVPGTSEHQLGLAFDIIDEDYPHLDDAQADTDTQKWLMENCARFGFILRYPLDSTDVTGIIYEPWHYRYVGVEVAQEITSLGITLEEYLGFQSE